MDTSCATRRAAGVNGPALPVQRGREGPLSINARGELTTEHIPVETSRDSISPASHELEY
jgi:hypothetical protein